MTGRQRLAHATERCLSPLPTTKRICLYSRLNEKPRLKYESSFKVGNTMNIMTTSPTPLLKLSMETIYCIFDYLTSTEQLEFALSCSCIYRAFRIYYLGFYSLKWEEVQWTTNLNKENGQTITRPATTKITTHQQHYTPGYTPPQPPLSPPPQIYRTTVFLANKLYLPFLSPDLPYCYVLCLSDSTLRWIPYPLSIHPASSLLYTPLLNTAATVANKKIYLFGGETYCGNVSNILYEIDVEKMEIKVVEAEGVIPGERCMHTIQTVAENWLAVFGGRRIAYDSNEYDEPIYYDAGDLYLFYIPYSTWISPTTLCSTPYPRSYHTFVAIDSALYVYGGQQIAFTTGCKREDDQIELNASFNKFNGAACESSRRYFKNSVHDDEDLWCLQISNFLPALSSPSFSILHSDIINDATTASIN
ncbi:6767_t:CDS:2 [Paraglomus occultum]|uniref:6767_t:CDS:1 n=1 Tax=Paraglomus occultum TaxID=144539 RepID=A0A9N8YTX7_9GLOM|nr:6767_t:CDS:2 [Paraglomus occultum]